MVPLLLASSRRRSSALAVLAGGIGIYATAAIGYQHFVKPAVNHSIPQPAVQSFALPAAAPTEQALPPVAPTQQLTSEHRRFVSGVPAPTPAAEQKPAAESQKNKRRETAGRETSGRETSGRERRGSSREVAFRPFNLFRPFF
jgi:hypothetical protein